MEHEGSLLHLQQSATCAYPKPDQSSPRPPNQAPYDTIIMKVGGSEHNSIDKIPFYLFKRTTCFGPTAGPSSGQTQKIS
jgi:hypothetical protein